MAATPNPHSALAQSSLAQVKAHPPGRVLHWLRLGWADFVASPAVGLLHGLAAAAFGAGLLVAAHDRFWLLSGAFSGFLLVAPIVATGLYAVSRAREAGAPANAITAMGAWRPRGASLVVFGLGSALAGTGWVLTSASLITHYAPAAIGRPLDFLRHVVLAPSGHLFEVWLGLGALLAAPVFASTVVALPLLLDRQIGVWAAVLTSWRVVMAQPLTMAVWAAVLMLLSLLGMLPGLLGLLVVVPWLAHASWHAYRDLVDASALPRV